MTRRLLWKTFLAALAGALTAANVFVVMSAPLISTVLMIIAVGTAGGLGLSLGLVWLSITLAERVGGSRKK